MIPRDAREVYCNERGEPIAYLPVDGGLAIGDLHRAQLYRINEARLEQLARRAQEKSSEGERFAVICIDVEDVGWAPVVELLMPGHDWEQFRARGEHPVARGVVPHALCADLVDRFYPAAGAAPDGVGIFVLAAGGIGIFAAGK